MATQEGVCRNCKSKVSGEINPRRRKAYFKCRCGNSWSAAAFYGQERSAGGQFAGAALGLLLGGPLGAIMGADIGGSVDTATCRRCNGTAYPTGVKRNGGDEFQCKGCKKFFVKR